MDPANEDRYETRIFVCHGCAAIERRRDAFTSGSTVEHGVRIAVTKQS